MKCPRCLAIKVARQALADSGYYEFHSKGDLHRNVLLNTLEDEGITFRDYDLSPTGIKAKNRKTEKVLQKLFKAATSPRPPCILCVRKHISQASALLQESLQGYPEHRDLAIGHLAEAEAEAEGISHDFAGRLRNERLKLERQEDYIPDCVDLLNISYNIKEMYGAIMTIENRVAGRFAKIRTATPKIEKGYGYGNWHYELHFGVYVDGMGGTAGKKPIMVEVTDTATQKAVLKAIRDVQEAAKAMYKVEMKYFGDADIEMAKYGAILYFGDGRDEWDPGDDIIEKYGKETDAVKSRYGLKWWG